MEILDMTSTMNILKDLFRYAEKRETVRIYSKSSRRYENHQVCWLLQEANLRKILKQFPNRDLYISFNTFKNTGKNTRKDGSASRKALFNAYNFCIDVDYKAGRDRNVPVEDAVAAIYELFSQPFGNEIPMPSYIEYGNQFRLIYCIEGHLSSERQFKAIDLVAKKIADALNSYPDFDFHAETQPLSSFIRFPGSINGKCREDAPVIQFSKIFMAKNGYEIDIRTRRTLSEYMDTVLGDWEKPEWYEKWKKTRKNKMKKHARSLKELNRSRMEDIIKIRSHIVQDGEIGYRNKLCFAFFIHAKQYFEFLDDALEALNRFNSEFSCPLPDGKLRNCICTAIHKDYYIKNATLLQFLDITEDLAAELKLNLATNASCNADYCKKYRNKKKKEKKKAGMLRSQQTARIKNTIVAMRRKNCRTENIMHVLGLSRKSVERYISTLIQERRLLKMKVAKKCQDIIESRKELSGEEFIQAFASAVETVGKIYATSDKSEQEWIYELSLFDKACRASGSEKQAKDLLPT